MVCVENRSLIRDDFCVFIFRLAELRWKELEQKI